MPVWSALSSTLAYFLLVLPQRCRPATMSRCCSDRKSSTRVARVCSRGISISATVSTTPAGLSVPASPSDCAPPQRDHQGRPHQYRRDWRSITRRYQLRILYSRNLRHLARRSGHHWQFSLSGRRALYSITDRPICVTASPISRGLRRPAARATRQWPLTSIEIERFDVPDDR